MNQRWADGSAERIIRSSVDYLPCLGREGKGRKEDKKENERETPRGPMTRKHGSFLLHMTKRVIIISCSGRELSFPSH
jgi:hypothetical protein